MMPLSWIKKTETNGEGQIYGACLLVLTVALIYFVKMSFQLFYVPGRFLLPCNESTKPDRLIVEIAGETNRKGIYFLSPQKAKINDLLLTAAIAQKRGLDERLLNRSVLNGDRIVIFNDDPYIKLERMESETRLALDMPIDINRVNIEELMLIPGIGFKTAGAISELREKKKGFSKVEDLKTINGFGEKKFDRIKGYIYIGDGE